MSGVAAARLARVGEETVCINLIVAGEICFGAKKRNSPRLSRQVEAVLAGLEVLSLEPPVQEAYAEIRHALETNGTLIGPNDLWIAAHARFLDLTLVTDNVNKFERVPGLKVENWLG